MGMGKRWKGREGRGRGGGGGEGEGGLRSDRKKAGAVERGEAETWITDMGGGG